MTSVFERYQEKSLRRYRGATRNNQRMDIQGLRMVAILTVLANHLWDWPRGGFIGVDVFFVISGFLITGNLLRDAESKGTVSFRKFYWNRVRRIVPAATVVLILTYFAATLVFLPFRSHQIGIDAMFAFIFVANWRFAIQNTDYFRATDAVSPIQHYWSLSIEEQFYFVWPALIFVISVAVLRRAWTHERRTRLAGGVVGVIIAASLGWALYQTETSATWAYFDTLARVWELGAGALLAATVGALARIPTNMKPVLSWVGLGLIATSLALIGNNSVGFPAPWALLPVVGAAMVIAAGVGTEPKYQAFLCNPISSYIGDISYSLYLVHWPVIVILGSLMDASWHFYLAVVALGFGLAIASYHFVETPLRRAEWGKFRAALDSIRKHRYHPQQSTGYAALAAAALVLVAASAYVDVKPEAYVHGVPPLAEVAPASLNASGAIPKLGPLATVLQGEILKALNTSEWPNLDPSMESVITGSAAPPEVYQCSVPPIPDDNACTWGSPSATIRAVLVGNSMGMAYSGPLREMALNSEGQFQLHTEAKAGCYFADVIINTEGESAQDECPERKQHAIDLINAKKPDVVIIANSYNAYTVAGTDHQLSADEWVKSVRAMVEQFRASTKMVVFLAPPPSSEADIRECFSRRSSTPYDCVTKVSDVWYVVAKAEGDLAESLGGVWVDSQPWFCNLNGTLCPSFVGSTATKVDRSHMSPRYGHKIYPVMAESFISAGVYPPIP